MTNPTAQQRHSRRKSASKVRNTNSPQGERNHNLAMANYGRIVPFRLYHPPSKNRCATMLCAT
jgi:hypothetical protein